jgi:hypothetical protein
MAQVHCGSTYLESMSHNALLLLRLSYYNRIRHHKTHQAFYVTYI